MNTFKDDVFTKLIYLGYLAYDEDTKEVYIPNKEILYGFNTIIRGSLWNTVAKKIELSRQLLKVVQEFREDTVGNLINKYRYLNNHKKYDIEEALKNFILFAFYSAKESYTK